MRQDLISQDAPCPDGQGQSPSGCDEVPVPQNADAAPSEAPEEPRFATEGEEEAFWSGVATGARMVGRDWPAPPMRGAGAPVAPAAPGESSAEAVEVRAGARGEPGRRRRVDGWTPLRMIRFLEVLAATGCVADACRSVGMSVSAAYALRDRREGRAWAVAWQAILIHRARTRLSDENLGRAMNGCVEQIVKDGVVVAERRRHDNRLSMAVLTRLDRLAERVEGDEDKMLRAVSEDIEAFYDCLEEGGDAEAFIEARRPQRPAPPPPRDPFAGEDQIDRIARITGVDGWSGYSPEMVPIDDLDPAEKHLWTTEQWIRAERSFYRPWLDLLAEARRLPPPALCFRVYEAERDFFLDAWERADGELDDDAVEYDEEEFLARLAELYLHDDSDGSGSFLTRSAGAEWQASTSST